MAPNCAANDIIGYRLAKGTETMTKYNSIEMLTRNGIQYDDAVKLRRIAMTLDRWHELECGDGNDYGSWAIERDDNGDGPPYMVHHHYMHGRGKDYTTRYRVPDRESGALKRLKTIMAKYPDYRAYVQGDPRGASLYILRPGDLEGLQTDEDISCNYTRGIPVLK